jgi:hypothetical protein
MTTVRLTNRNDVYTTQEGDREVFALRGDDRITVEGLFRGEGATDFLDVHGGPGDDRILGIRHDTQLLFGDRGNDYIEVGHAVEDSLADGGPGNDVLRSLGGEGQGTSLRGGTGDDRLFGSLDEGLTTLDGGPGRDLLTGGASDEEDRFYAFFADPSEAPDRDVVRGFQDGRDRIETRIDGLSFSDADVTTPGDQDFVFVGRTRSVDPGEFGFFRQGGDTVVVGNNGEQTAQLVLDGFRGALDAGDFLLNDFFP